MFISVLLIARRMPFVQRISLSLLIPYIFMVIVATLIVRKPLDEPSIILTPFVSFKEALTNDFWEFEIRGNILLFVPIGFLLSMVMNRTKVLPIILGTSLSICIEIVQLLTRCGTCEVDDLISNFFGVLIGYIIYLPVRMLRELDSE